MLKVSTILTYPILTLVSIGKKSFENLSTYLKKSGDTVARLLQPAEVSLAHSRSICQSIFSGKKKLFCIIDDTLIKKIYSRYMHGAGMFFDTKIGRQIMAYRLVMGMIEEKFSSKEDIAKIIVKTAIKFFPDIKIIVCADGLYPTESFVRWCKDNKIAAEMRMHSSRVVFYRGEKIALKQLLQKKGMCPKGRQMARTIKATWHDIELDITIVRRIDKNNNESIVFQLATYDVIPRLHVEHYKVRWLVEKAIRTSKQYLGLQECFSQCLQTQHNHVAAVLLAYALVQLQMKHQRLKTPEEAIRRSKMKNVNESIACYARLEEIFNCVAA